MLRNDLERSLAGAGLEWTVSVASQVQLDQIGDVRIVFDDDDDQCVTHNQSILTDVIEV